MFRIEQFRAEMRTPSDAHVRRNVSSKRNSADKSHESRHRFIEASKHVAPPIRLRNIDEVSDMMRAKNAFEQVRP